MNAIQTGQIVISTSGRDKDDHYVVIDIKENLAYLANGRNRKMDHPKVKKFRHLQPTTMINDEIALRIEQDLKVMNIDIRTAISKFTETGTEKTED